MSLNPVVGLQELASNSVMAHSLLIRVVFGVFSFLESVMTSVYTRLVHRAMALLLGLFLAGSWAQSSPSPSSNLDNSPNPFNQEAIDALSQANAAVVGVRVQVAKEARSAQTLGQRRSGTGVAIGPDGLILTIGYLMLEAQSIQIVTPSKKTIPARAVAYDLATGFGLIRPLVPVQDLQAVKFGSLGDLKLGQVLVAATGAQAGGEAPDISLTQLVSRRAFSGYWEYHIDAAAFTSPPINNHSGAALFNQRGELMGIGSLFVSDALGIGRNLPGNMFVPVDLLKPILAELLQTGSSKVSRRPWVGLTSSEQAGRVQIVRVNKDGPAQAAGLEPGDVVLAVNGTQVATLEAFYKKLWEPTQPDVEITLTVLQGAAIRNIKLQAVDRMSTLLKPEGI
jgi:serine protease Do